MPYKGIALFFKRCEHVDDSFACKTTTSTLIRWSRSHWSNRGNESENAICTPQKQTCTTPCQPDNHVSKHGQITMSSWHVGWHFECHVITCHVSCDTSITIHVRLTTQTYHAALCWLTLPSCLGVAWYCQTIVHGILYTARILGDTLLLMPAAWPNYSWSSDLIINQYFID